MMVSVCVTPKGVDSAQAAGKAVSREKQGAAGIGEKETGSREKQGSVGIHGVGTALYCSKGLCSGLQDTRAFVRCDGPGRHYEGSEPKGEDWGRG